MRRSIIVEGLGHGSNPIPPASRVGPFIATGGIRGVDPATGVMPDDLGEQVRLMFANLKILIEAGGGTLDGVLKMTFWIRSPEARPLINAEWVRAFPDETSRPARHLLTYELGHGMLVQCDALAVAAGDPS